MSQHTDKPVNATEDASESRGSASTPPLVKWRNVPGFEGMFQYSNTGIIRMMDVDEDA